MVGPNFINVEPTPSHKAQTFTQCNGNGHGEERGKLHSGSGGNYRPQCRKLLPAREEHCGLFHRAKAVSVEVTVGDKDFDGTRDAAVESATLTGVLAGDAVAVQAGKVSFAHAAPGTWEVTLEKLTLTGADAGNYSLTNPQPGITATIRANDRYLDLSQTFPEETGSPSTAKSRSFPPTAGII